MWWIVLGVTVWLVWSYLNWIVLIADQRRSFKRLTYGDAIFCAFFALGGPVSIFAVLGSLPSVSKRLKAFTDREFK